MMPGLRCCELVSTRGDGRGNWPLSSLRPGMRLRSAAHHLWALRQRIRQRSIRHPFVRGSLSMNARAATTHPSIDFDVSSSLSPGTSNR